MPEAAGQSSEPDGHDPETPPPEVTVQNRQRRLPVDTHWFTEHLARVVRREGLTPGTLSVVIVSARRIRRLNRRFHGRDEPTDVLAFDYRGDVSADTTLWEVFVSAEAAAAAARERDLPVDGELFLYCVHGILHLAGHEDTTVEGRRKMWRRQRVHLKQAGFPAERWVETPDSEP